MKGLALALALSLAAGSPAFGPREPTAQRIPVGTFLKAVETDAGRLAVYRNGAGCDLWLEAAYEQTVSLAVCGA